MKYLRFSTTLAVLSSLLTLGACASREDAAGALGSVDLGLQIAGGATIVNAASFVVSGPGSFVRTGTMDLSQSATLSTIVGGLPAGTGYTVALDATSTDGATRCAGAAPFAISANATTAVSVRLQCREAARTGSVLVTGALNVCPVIDGVSANPGEVVVGGSLALAVLAHDTDGAPAALGYQWSLASGSLGAGAFGNPAAANPTFTCAQAGTANVTVVVSDGDCTDTYTVPVSCSAATAATPMVRINEVESSGGVPGDWVELFNAGPTPADISGWKFKDNDDTHAYYVVPAGTLIPPGGLYVLEEAAFVFGLGAADSARLWDASGTIVDSYSWTAHASTTYGRCPDGTGGFVTTSASTKGARNACGGGAGGAGGGAGAAGGNGGVGGAGGNGGAGGTSSSPWPGSNSVVTVDDAAFFGTNMSGLVYEPASGANPAVLWAVQNSPSKLHRLLSDGTTYRPDTANGWSAGKLLHYTNGAGAPDSEGITKVAWADSAMYVSTERDNNASSVSRLSILRFDTGAAGTELTATHDWNLTADLPAVGPNLGLEAITFIPDSALVAGGVRRSSDPRALRPRELPEPRHGPLLRGRRGNRRDPRLRAGPRGRRLHPLVHDAERTGLDHGPRL